MKLFILVFIAIYTSNAHPKNIYIILDSSGSMAGLDNTLKPKMKSSKSAVNNIIDKLPNETNISLISYGNTRKKDCSDINTLYDFGKIDKSKIKSKIMALKPLGNTPIERSLRKTIGSIKTNKEVSLILITDGIESCKGNPCTYIKTVKKKSNLNFKIDVIGFDIRKESDSLKCIADNSGGQYIDAKNSDELLNKSEAMILDELAPKGTLELVEQNKVVLEYIIFDEEKKVITKGHNFGLIRLSPGTYSAKITQSITKETTELKDIIISTNKNTVKSVSFEKGIKVVFKYDSKRFGVPKITNVKSKKTFIPNHTIQRISHGEKDTVQIVPGTYVLKAIGRKDQPTYTSDPRVINSSIEWSFGNEKKGNIKITFKKKRGSVFINSKNFRNRHWVRNFSSTISYPVGEYKVTYRGKKQIVTVKEDRTLELNYD